MKAPIYIRALSPAEQAGIEAGLSSSTDFLEWVCEEVQAQGKRALVLIWDNATWHVSKQVRTWLREHNQTVVHEVKAGKTGVRIIPCW